MFTTRMLCLIAALPICAAAQDASVTPGSVAFRETLRHTFRIVGRRPGMSPISEREIGQSFISASIDLNGFDMSRPGTNSSFGLELGAFSWDLQFRRDPRWRSGKKVVRFSGFNPYVPMEVRPFVARWDESQLRITGRAHFWRRDSYFNGRTAVAGEYVNTPSGRRTNSLPFMLTLRSVADNEPGITNTLTVFTNIPAVVHVVTRTMTTPYGDAPHGSVRVSQ